MDEIFLHFQDWILVFFIIYHLLVHVLYLVTIYPQQGAAADLF